MTVEEMGNKCLQERGYMVIATAEWTPAHSRGDIITDAGSDLGQINHPLVVVAKTDRTDWEKQARFLGVDEYSSEGGHFYRVTAE